MEKREKKIFSFEFILILLFIMIFLFIIIILSCLFYKSYHQKQKQLRKIQEITFEKIWTIETSSTNVFKESNDDKIQEKKDINLKLKQIDIQASLV
jgi:flagellar basal body-associated protein FliL